MNSSGGYSPQSGTFHLKKNHTPFHVNFWIIHRTNARERIDWCKQKAPSLIFAGARVASGFCQCCQPYYSTSFCSHAAQRHNKECIYLINDFFKELFSSDLCVSILKDLFSQRQLIHAFWKIVSFFMCCVMVDTLHSFSTIFYWCLHSVIWVMSDVCNTIVPIRDKIMFEINKSMRSRICLLSAN